MRAAPPLILGAFALGALVRIGAGLPLAQADLASGREGSRPPPAGSAESTVFAFYDSIAKGDYGKAWELSLEPAWEAAGSIGYGSELRPSPRVRAWTAKAEFVRRCEEDLGGGIRLNGIAAAQAAEIPAELQGGLLSSLGGVPLIPVRASGQMLGACLIYHWDKDLAVAEVDGRYRVILPGTKAAKALFHQSWFSDLALVGSLRAGGP